MDSPKFFLLGQPVANERSLQQLTKEQLLWTTYRKKIAGLNSDAGWGCTVRSLQMLLTNGFVRARRSLEQEASSPSASQEEAKKAAASLVIDWDTADFAHFSLPRLMANSQAKPGKWFGPAEATALIIRSSPPPPRPSSNAAEGLCTSPSSTSVPGGFVPKGQGLASSSSDSLASMATATATATNNTETKGLNSSPSALASSASSPSNDERENLLSLDVLRIILCNDATIAKTEVRAVASAPTVAAAAERVSASDMPALQHAAEGAIDDGSSSALPSSSATPTTPWRPVLAIVPLRLGLNEVQIEYLPLLAAVMRLSCFQGAVGGSPRHSVFFCGVNVPPTSSTVKGSGGELVIVNDLSALRFLYLDPHTTQECPPLPPPVAAATAATAVAAAAPASSTITTTVSERSGEALPKAAASVESPVAAAIPSPASNRGATGPSVHASASTGSLAGEIASSDGSAASTSAPDSKSSNGVPSMPPAGPIFEGSVSVGGSVAASVPLYPKASVIAAVPDSFVASMTPPHGAPFTMKPSNLDPTISLGFLFTTELEFDQFCADVEELWRTGGNPIPGAVQAVNAVAAAGSGSAAASSQPTPRVTKLFEVVEKRAAMPFDDEGLLGELLAYDGEDLDLDVDGAVNDSNNDGEDWATGGESNGKDKAKRRSTMKQGSVDAKRASVTATAAAATADGGGRGFFSAFMGLISGVFSLGTASAVPATSSDATTAAGNGKKAKRRKESLDAAEDKKDSDGKHPEPASSLNGGRQGHDRPEESSSSSETNQKQPDASNKSGEEHPISLSGAAASTATLQGTSEATKTSLPSSSSVHAHRPSAYFVERNGRGSFSVSDGSFSSPPAKGSQDSLSSSRHSDHAAAGGAVGARGGESSDAGQTGRSRDSSFSGASLVPKLASPPATSGASRDSAYAPVNASPVVVTPGMAAVPVSSPLPGAIGNVRAHKKSLSGGGESGLGLIGALTAASAASPAAAAGIPQSPSILAVGPNSPLLAAASALASTSSPGSSSTGRVPPLPPAAGQQQHRASPILRPSPLGTTTTGSPPLRLSPHLTASRGMGVGANEGNAEMSEGSSSSNSHANNNDREPPALAI